VFSAELSRTTQILHVRHTCYNTKLLAAFNGCWSLYFNNISIVNPLCYIPIQLLHIRLRGTYAILISFWCKTFVFLCVTYAIILLMPLICVEVYVAYICICYIRRLRTFILSSLEYLCTGEFCTWPNAISKCLVHHSIRLFKFTEYKWLFPKVIAYTRPLTMYVKSLVIPSCSQ
jgi:hypothetical protein